jgi:hypothetical protein
VGGWEGAAEPLSWDGWSSDGRVFTPLVVRRCRVFSTRKAALANAVVVVTRIDEMLGLERDASTGERSWPAACRSTGARSVRDVQRLLDHRYPEVTAQMFGLINHTTEDTRPFPEQIEDCIA